MSAGPALLEVTGVSAGYGSVTVVQPIDLSLAPGTVLALLGPNGAGKTTLMLTLAGLLPRLSGSVSLGGKAVPSDRPSATNDMGIVLVPDDRALFTGLTVRENISIARPRNGPTLDEVLDVFPALRARLDIPAGALSGGEQQMLAVGRALVQRPRVLLIDEMSMGLAPIIVEELLPIVRGVADASGAAVVLVEQHVRLALAVADEAMVLVHGAVSLRGTAKELAADPQALEAAYLASPGTPASARS